MQGIDRSVKKNILKRFSIKQQVLFADFNWQNILDIVSTKSKKVKDLPKYPIVKRDLALLLDNKIQFKDLYDLAFQSERQLLKHVDLFDVYEGEKLPDGKKSYALSFLLQDESKTLNDKRIDKIMKKLQNSFEKNFDASLR